MANLPVLPPLPEPIEVDMDDVTEGTLNGTGAFDKLMSATKVHLTEEYSKGRIGVSDYSQVYLGALTNIINQSIAFTLTKDKTAAEVQLLRIQEQTAELNKSKVLAELEMINSNIAANVQQIAMSKAQQINVEAEKANIITQGLLLEQNIRSSKTQESYVRAQQTHLLKQTELVDENISMSKEQKTSLIAERDNIIKKGAHIEQQTSMSKAQELNVEKELEVTKEKLLLLKQELILVKDKVKVSKVESSDLALIDMVTVRKNKVLVIKDESTISSDKAEISTQEAKEITLTANETARNKILSENANKATEEVKLIKEQTDNLKNDNGFKA